MQVVVHEAKMKRIDSTQEDGRGERGLCSLSNCRVRKRTRQGDGGYFGSEARATSASVSYTFTI
jgi:hypothetical protein